MGPISLRNCTFGVDHVSNCNFDPLSNCLNTLFRFRFEVKVWIKIEPVKQMHHVILNSFKHFSGPSRTTYFDAMFR